MSSNEAQREGSSPSRDDLIGFLDGFRAAEALGEATVGAWLRVCGSEHLRGGLRSVRGREGLHARLLEERIRELGAEPSAEIPEEIRRSALEDSGSRDRTDIQKLERFVQQFPDVDAALAPIHAMADRLREDPETQSLLRTIAHDERATLEFLRTAYEHLKSG
jgi:hypothetical protein